MPPPGKRLRCPECKGVFSPSAPDADDGYEEEEEKPVVKAVRREGRGERRPRRGGATARGNFQFDGGASDYFVLCILSTLLTIFTFGLGSPWAWCMQARWQIEHTIVQGRRLRFNGTGADLFVLFIVTYILCIITLGIYLFWGVPKVIAWFVEHTDFEHAE